MKFELKDYHQNITDEELLNDLRQVANKLSQSFVTAIQQDNFGKFNSSTFKRRFGSWLTALEKAGFQKTRRQANNRIPEEELFNNLEEVWVKLGRQPRFWEMITPTSKYSGYAYKRRFGTWIKALEIFVAYINKEDSLSSEDLTHVLLSRLHLVSHLAVARWDWWVAAWFGALNGRGRLSYNLQWR